MTESIGNCTRFKSTQLLCVLGVRALFTVVAVAAAASFVVAFVLNLLLFLLFSIFSATVYYTEALFTFFSITQILTGFFSLFSKSLLRTITQTHTSPEKLENWSHTNSMLFLCSLFAEIAPHTHRILFLLLVFAPFLCVQRNCSKVGLVSGGINLIKIDKRLRMAQTKS